MNEMLKESFDNFDMHNLFHKIYTNAKTCVLKIYFPDNIVKTIYFSEGNIVFASSNAEKDKLVNILLKYKKINQEQLETVMRQMDKTISLGRNLVNMGFITHKELIWAVKVQIIGIIHSTVILESGEYSIQEGPLPEGVINLPLNTLKIIFDSLVMFKNREWIAKQINAPDAVYKKTVLFEEGKTKLLANEELRKIADSIDGKKTVNELAGLSNIEDFKTFKLIYALKFLNLIEEKSEEVPPAEDLFEIADEPSENLELANDFAAKVKGEEENFKSELLEEDNAVNNAENNDIEGKGEDVFVEFEIEENSSIEISESSEEEDDSKESKDFAEENDDEFKLTEADIDSVIIDEDNPKEKPSANIIDDGETTQQIENAKEVVEEIIGDKKDENIEDSQEQTVDDKTVISGNIDEVLNGQNDDDKTVIDSQELMTDTGTVEDEDSEDISDLLPSKDKSSHVLLYTLIFILLVVGLGYGYYKYFYSKGILYPGAKTVSSVKKEDTVQLDKTPDVTENVVTDLKKGLQKDENNNSKEKINTGDTLPKELEAEIDSDNDNAVESESLSNKNVSTNNTVENKTEKSDKVTKKIDTEANKAKETSGESTKHQTTKEAENIATKKAETIYTEKSADFSIEAMLSNARNAFSDNPEGYTIRIEIACMEDTVKTAFEKAEEPDKLYLVPKKMSRGTCYIVCYGVFEDYSKAVSELNRLHSIFFEDGNKPFVSPVSQLKKYLK
jgi:hypothetical protein